MEALEDRLAPALLTVNTLADTIAPDKFTSLREAILAANAAPGDDTINFSVSGTINLSGALPDLDSDLAIKGPGASCLTVRRDTGGDYRIFSVPAGRTIALSGLTIANGRARLSPGGGGIFNSGTLTVSNSTLSGNSVSITFGGGGIFNSGTLTVRNSTLSGNSAGSSGGGGINNSGTLTVRNSTLSGNRAYVSGGGIFNSGTLTVSDSTLWGNYAARSGGGIRNFGTVTLNNSLMANSGNGDVRAEGGSLRVSGVASATTWQITGGTVLVDAMGVLSAPSAYVQTAGRTTLHGGLLSAALTDLQGGILDGAGFVLGDLRNAARIDVGGAGAVGALFVVGDYTQTAAGILNLDLAGTTLLTDCDFFYVDGTASLAGTLNVNRLGSYLPNPDDLFLPVFSEGLTSGTFTTITGLTLSPTRALLAVYFDHGLVLYTVAV